MQELLVDFITSLDGYGPAEGWTGLWGLGGPEHLSWLDEQPERDYTILMGANTYRLMSGSATEFESEEADDVPSDEEGGSIKPNNMSEIIFSSTLQPPWPWASYPNRQRK